MIREWEIISRELLTRGEIDVLIVNGRARHFEDSTELRLGRASLEHGSLNGLIRSLGQMRNRSEQVDLCGGYLSMVFAWKRNIGQRVLELIIPQYEMGERWVNQQDLASLTSGTPPAATYDTLTRLATHASERDVQVVVCFFPTREDYSIGEAFAVLEKQRLIQILDLTEVGLVATDFQDSTHLNSIGRNRFTAIYLQRLQGIIEKR
jgi:hypothetical protein